MNAASKAILPPADWLNPRRRLNAERLVAYLAWNGRKAILTPDRYADVQDDLRLDRYAVDQAADDLYPEERSASDGL